VPGTGRFEYIIQPYRYLLTGTYYVLALSREATYIQVAVKFEGTVGIASWRLKEKTKFGIACLEGSATLQLDQQNNS
jgi:hypothetical protein